MLSVVVVHWRGYGRPFITNWLGCCTKVSLLCVIMPGPILLTRPVTGFDLVAGILGNTLPTVPVLPSDFHFSGPLRSSNHLATDSWHQFLYAGLQASILQWDRCLNVNGDYTEIWCVPFATNVPCTHQRLNKVLDIRLFVTLCFENPFISTLMLNSTFHVVCCLQKLLQTAPVSAMPQMSLRHIQHQPNGGDDCKIWRFHFAEPFSC